MFFTFFSGLNKLAYSRKDKIALGLGNGEYAFMKAEEQVVLSFNNNRTLSLSNCLFVQEEFNFISFVPQFIGKIQSLCY